MKMASDWRLILRKAWSVRLMALAVVLSGAEVIMPLYADAFPRHTFALLSFFVVIAAMIARFVSQPRMHGDGE